MHVLENWVYRMFSLFLNWIKNLVLVSKITTDNSYIVEFISSDFVIKDPNSRTIGKGYKQGQFYALDSSFQEALSTIKEGNSFSLWH